MPSDDGSTDAAVCTARIDTDATEAACELEAECVFTAAVPIADCAADPCVQDECCDEDSDESSAYTNVYTTAATTIAGLLVLV